MRIITFNVGLLDAWIFGKKIFEFTPYTRERAEALPSALGVLDCDIFFIQEIYHQADIARLHSYLVRVLPYSVHSKLPASRLRLGHGLAIYSKYPLREPMDTKFSRQLIDEGIVGPKGFVSAVLDVPQIGEIFVANAHTTAGGFFEHPESSKTDNCRTKQIQQLALTASRRSMYSILAGDLNCGPNVSKGVFDSLLQLGFKRPEDICCVPGLEPTWDPENPLNAKSPHRTSPPQRIDHVLFSDGLASRMDVTSVNRIFTEDIEIAGRTHTISDHYGLSVCAKSIPDV